MHLFYPIKSSFPALQELDKKVLQDPRDFYKLDIRLFQTVHYESLVSRITSFLIFNLIHIYLTSNGDQQSNQQWIYGLVSSLQVTLVLCARVKQYNCSTFTRCKIRVSRFINELNITTFIVIRIGELHCERKFTNRFHNFFVNKILNFFLSCFDLPSLTGLYCVESPASLCHP